jgi:DNA-binding transcriptional LysR family regulator
VLDRACAAQGLQPTVTLQVSAPDAVIDLARRGLGVAILSESMTRHVPAARRQGPGAPHGDDRLARVPLAGIEIPAVLALVWKDGANPALQELVRRCGAAFAGPPPHRHPPTTPTPTPTPTADAGATSRTRDQPMG